MKIFKKPIKGILIFVFGSSIYSCQNAHQTDNPIKGKWVIEKISSNETNENQGIAILTLIMAMDGVDQLEFASNGKYHVRNEKDSVLSTSEYEYSKNENTLKTIDGGEEKSMIVVFNSKNKMKLKSEDGVTMSLKRKE